jgi:GT2 family glycosyltransferase
MPDNQHRHDPVVVIIVNYRCATLTCCCVESIMQHVHTPVEIVVVDNSPTSELDRIVDAYPEVHGIAAAGNAGFAAGCNLGLSYALQRNRRYALLLNPDARTEQDFIAPLTAVMEQEPRVAAASPTILDDDELRAVQFAGGRMRWLRGGPKHVLDLRHPVDQCWYPEPFLTGCAMLLRLAAVRDVGMMPEDYFLYFEDADYIQRILSRGWTAAWVPAAVVLHSLSSTTRRDSALYVYHFSRNRIIFMRRWSPRGAFWGFMIYNTLVKLPGSFLVFGIWRRHPALAWAFVRGYLAGLAHRCES